MVTMDETKVRYQGLARRTNVDDSTSLYGVARNKGSRPNTVRRKSGEIFTVGFIPAG